MTEQRGKPIFVVGTSRSGTTLLHQLLASHSRVVGIYETSILRRVDTRKRPLEAEVRKIARSHEEARIVLDYFSMAFQGMQARDVDPYRFLDTYGQAHCAHFHRAAYVEKTPVHAHFIAGLLSRVADSRVVVVMRDPRAIVASRLRTPRISRGKAAHMPRKVQFYLNLSSVMFTFRELDRWFSPQGPLAERVSFVRYEDVVTRPEEALSRLFQSLGLPWEPVHIRIHPLDLRLEARDRLGLMNSSFGRKRLETVTSASLVNWTGTLSPREAAFTAACVWGLGLRSIKALYPALAEWGSGGLEVRLMDGFSRADHYLFMRRNFKALGALEASNRPARAVAR